MSRVRNSHNYSFSEVRLLLILAATGFVLWRAWVCDDAYITFRHVENCLAGYGPVFNVSERVQGFTHPLWFLWLLIGSMVLDHYAAAVLGGLICTGLLVWVFARGLRCLHHAHLLLPAGMTVLLGSRSFVEFQTSGLETSLANLLVVTLFALWPLMKEESADGLPLLPAVFICSLLLVTRADLVAICGPVLAWSAINVLRMRPRRFGCLAIAMAPVLAWYAFATFYYGTPLPNTAYAKLAFPPRVALSHGLNYLWDYPRHEPIHALVMIVSPLAWIVWLTRMRRSSGRGNWASACLPAGVLLHIVYVACVGGDFMRGRFMMPALVSSVVLGCRMLGHLMPEGKLNGQLSSKLFLQRPIALTCVAIVAAGYVTLWDAKPRIPSDQQIAADGGIADEYAWYAGDWYRPRFQPPEFTRNEWASDAITSGLLLDRYSETYGPITIVWGVMGILPYYAGPKVSVIDVLGLTDAFVARCPADPASRVGHIGHAIPPEYLATRGAINTLPDAFERIKALDPTLVADARFMQQKVEWTDQQALQLWRNVQLVTTGPLWSWERLKAIPAYALPRRRPFTTATCPTSFKIETATSRS